MKLDKKDQKILFELCANSRQPSTIISKRVGLSREVVEYRIKQLVKKGVIKKFVTLVNVDIFGYSAYNVFLLMQNFSPEKENEIISYLSNHPAIRWMVTCFGKWDIFLRISAKSKENFDSIFSEICERLGDNLRSFEVIIGVKKLKSVNPLELFYFHNESQVMKTAKKAYNSDLGISNEDILMLKEMSNNSRISLIELSKKTGLTAEAVKYRIKRLESNGIIEGYSALIDVTVLEHSWYVIMFSLKPLTKTDEKSLKTLLQLNKKAWFAEKDIGAWNLRLEILAKDTKDFHKTLVELRNKLQSHINSFELLLVFKEHVNERFPKMIEDEFREGLKDN